MRWFRSAALVLFSLILLVMLASLLFSPVAHVERTQLIHARPAVIFSQVNDLQKAAQWIPWSAADSSMQLQLSSPASGPGAWYSWGNAAGNITGRFRITAAVPDKSIRYTLQLKKLPPSYGSFQLAPAADGGNTLVKWTLDTRVGWWPWWKFYGAMMDRLAGPGMEAGLARLKNLCEKAAPL